MPTFGEKLRKLRAKRGLSQRDIAKQLGYSSHTIIAMIESGERGATIELVLKLMALFNVTADQLIRDDLDIE